MQNLVNVDDFEAHAYTVLPKNALDYYRSGAGAQTTLRNNRDAFDRLRIRPRCLRDVAKRSLATRVLGQKVSMPVGIAPTAMQRMAHPDGETANVKAAEAHNVIFIQSTISTSSIEEVAEAAPDAFKWFQLYIYNDRELTINLIRRVEKAGFKALVLTVDTPFFGIRYPDMKNKFSLPPHLKFANFDGLFATKIHEKNEGTSALNNYVSGLFDSSLSWKDVSWLKTVTNLPIVLKGILRADDARIAREIGVSAILVSNHGARQIDGTPASIEALPEIVKAVGDKLEVYLDGGIRTGNDVFKALALGAKMVFIGRPALWGLAHNGESGVRKVLEILRNELDSSLAMTGCRSIEEISEDFVVHENYYCKL